MIEKLLFFFFFYVFHRRRLFFAYTFVFILRCFILLLLLLWIHEIIFVSLTRKMLIKFFANNFSTCKERWLSDSEMLNKAHACIQESFLLPVNSLPSRKYLHILSGTLAIEFRYLYPLCLLPRYNNQDVHFFRE